MTSTNKIERMTFIARVTEIAGRVPQASIGSGNGQNPYVTRLEAALMMAEVMPPVNLGIAGGLKPPYQDIGTLTPAQADAVSKVYHLGILVDGDGSFDPYRHVSEQEATHAFSLMQERVQGSKQPVPYEIVTDPSSLPQEVRDAAQAAQGTSGLVTVRTPDATYAILSAGERTSGGYSIEIRSVVQGNGQIEILVNLIEPDPDAFTIQVITTPQVILRLAPTDQPIIVVNEKELH